MSKETDPVVLYGASEYARGRTDERNDVIEGQLARYHAEVEPKAPEDFAHAFPPKATELSRAWVHATVRGEMIADGALPHARLDVAVAKVVERHAEVVRGLAMEASSARAKVIELERRVETLGERLREAPAISRLEEKVKESEVRFNLERRRRRELVVEQVELNQEVGIHKRALHHACVTLFDCEVRLEKAEGHHPPEHDVEAGIIPTPNRVEMLLREAREEGVGEPLHRFSTFEHVEDPTPFPSTANATAAKVRDRIASFKASAEVLATKIRFLDETGTVTRILEALTVAHREGYSRRQRPARELTFDPSYEQLKEETKRLQGELVDAERVKEAHGDRPDWLAAENLRLASKCQQLSEERDEVARETLERVERLREDLNLTEANRADLDVQGEAQRDLLRKLETDLKAAEEEVTRIVRRYEAEAEEVRQEHEVDMRLAADELKTATEALKRLQPAPGEPGWPELKILTEGLERERTGLRFKLRTAVRAVRSVVGENHPELDDVGAEREIDRLISTAHAELLHLAERGTPEEEVHLTERGETETP